MPSTCVHSAERNKLGTQKAHAANPAPLQLKALLCDRSHDPNEFRILASRRRDQDSKRHALTNPDPHTLVVLKDSARRKHTAVGNARSSPPHAGSKPSYGDRVSTQFS
jgi:hypothetical protein